METEQYVMKWLLYGEINLEGEVVDYICILYYDIVET